MTPLESALRLLGTIAEPEFAGPFEMVLYEQIAYLADDAKRMAAFQALRQQIGTTPEALLRAGHERLAKIAALGGPYAEVRAERMLSSARLGEPALTKKALMRFSMIGESGAEKILLFSGALAVLPLESNGLRVVTRLGLVPEAKNYSTMYRAARNLLPPDPARLRQAFLLLRHHGIAICKRNSPKCHECPLRTQCPAAR